MNRILFEAEEIRTDGTVWLTDHRFEHLRAVLRATSGQTVATGTVNGLAGTSRILSMTNAAALLAVKHTQAVVSPWLDLLLALPRPKVLRRLWPQLAALGVGHIVLLNAAKVEKYYFSSQWLKASHYRPLLLDGLMQAGTTTLPQVTVAPCFKPFVEDQLAQLFPASQRLVAQPMAGAGAAGTITGARPLLAIGPEGGWTSYELQLLQQHEFKRFTLGPRILRSDTACVAVIAVLGHLLQISATT